MALALRILLFPWMLLRWVHNPDWTFRDGLREDRPGADDDHPYLPEGYFQGDFSVLQRRRLLAMAGVWGSAALLTAGIVIAVALQGEAEFAGGVGAVALIAGCLALALRARSRAHRRLSVHLGLAVDPVEVERGDTVEVWPSAPDLRRVEVGLVCRKRWTRWQHTRSSLLIVGEQTLHEAWVPAGEPPIRLTVPRSAPRSDEDHDQAVYWVVSARARVRGLQRRTDVPIWVRR